MKWKSINFKMTLVLLDLNYPKLKILKINMIICSKKIKKLLNNTSMLKIKLRKIEEMSKSFD